MAFAFQGSNSIEDTNDDNSIAVQLTGVNAGDLIVLWNKFEGDVNNNSTVSASDGTSSFTAGTVNHHNGVNDLHGAFLYLLASVATGTVTYTVTISESVPFKWLHARRYSYAGTAQFDATDVTAEGTSDTAITTGAITTSGTNHVAIVGTAFYQSTTFDAQTIGGTTGTNLVGNVATSAFSMDRILTGAGLSSGAGVHAAHTSNAWVTSIIAFKESAGGGGRVTKNTRAFPLGIEIGMNWRG